MAQVENKSNEAIESQSEVHKDSGLAVGEAKWYIAECKPTRERTLCTMLQKAENSNVSAKNRWHRVTFLGKMYTFVGEIFLFSRERLKINSQSLEEVPSENEDMTNVSDNAGNI